MDSNKVQDAHSWLDDNQNIIISFLQNLIRIPTFNPPGDNYDLVADLVKNEMENSGCKTKLFESPENYVELCGKSKLGLDSSRINVVGYAGNDDGSPTLVFNSHSDVVPISSGWTVDPVGGEIKDGKIYGRGAADNKSGIVSIIAAFRALHEMKIDLKGQALLTSTVDEELGGFSGLKYLVDKNIVKGNLGISADSRIGQITNALNGRLRWRVTSHGKSVHSSMANLGINAIEKMSSLVLSLQSHSLDLQKRYSTIPAPPASMSKFLRPIASVGTINGGIKDNIVPDHCYIDLDRRVTPEENINDARDELSSIINDTMHNVPDANYESVELSFREPCLTSANHPFLLKSKSIAEETLDHDVPIYGSTGSSDMQYMINDCNMPSFGFGPIRPDCNVHGIDEFVYIEDVISTAKVYSSIIIDTLTD